MKYIDAECLRVEIEKRIKSSESCPFIEAEFGAEVRREGNLQGYKEVLSILDSLQQEQPEVDFEKELDRIWFDKKFGDNFDNSAVDFANVRWICNHFYKLGKLCSK